MRIPRGPGLLVPVLAALTAATLGALAMATAPDLPPPPNLLYPPLFIGRDGDVRQSTLDPPPGVDTRPLFVDRDGGVLIPTLDPPPGLDTRAVFITRDGHINQSTLAPPPDLLYPGPFIQRDGSVAPGYESLVPPPGLDTRGVFIGRDGEVVDSSVAAPAATPGVPLLQLRGVYPNPFNPAVEISFQLGSAGPVRVSVVDTRGRLVRVLHDGPLPADLHVLRWDGRDDAGRLVAAGSYLIRVQSGDQEVGARAALVK